jgi:hypothetical protein
MAKSLKNGKTKWQKISKKWLKSKRIEQKIVQQKTSIKGIAVGFEGTLLQFLYFKNCFFD